MPTQNHLSVMSIDALREVLNTCSKRMITEEEQKSALLQLEQLLDTVKAHQQISLTLVHASNQAKRIKLLGDLL